ncbi:MAG TPA: hypothetical protein VEO58_03000 [Gemmatimonadales bacterium]|nr:hypothetical protein [Gemmatimonadales bacterium]
MSDKDISPQELARQYLVTHDYYEGLGPKPQRRYRALSVWEDWIVSAPEKAWPVFEEIVRLRPDDDDVLEQVCHRLELLLEEHWELWHERVTRLVEGNARLTRIMPRAVLEKAHYEPKYRTIPELVEAWIAQSLNHRGAFRLDELIREDPLRALALALEVINRAPLHGFTSFDVLGPLMDLLRQHGPEVIDQVEAAAATSVAVRRVLWRMRPQQGDGSSPNSVPEEVWTRVVRAAGDTTDYNTDDPPGVASALAPDEEAVVASWFVYNAKFWSWEALRQLVENDPETAWQAIEMLVGHPNAEDVLDIIGAGPLEDLLAEHGERFVTRVEQRALHDDRFRACLGGVWLDPEDIPENIVRRLHDASEGAALILDPRPIPAPLLELEREAATMLMAGDHWVLEALRQQWRKATVVRRSYGWSGGHVELSVPQEVPPITDADFVTIGDVRADIHFLERPATFSVYVVDGRLHGLTCHLGGVDWPDPVLVRRLYYVRRDETTDDELEVAERDLDWFRERWDIT